MPKQNNAPLSLTYAVGEQTVCVETEAGLISSLDNQREDLSMLRSRRSIGIILLGVMLLGILPMSASAEGLFSLDSTHKYLGFGTIGLTAATALTNGELDAHEPLAYATAACALSTVLTGLIAHGDRFDLSDGFFSKENLHIMAGTIGAIALTAGVAIAAGSYETSTDPVTGGDINDVDGGHSGLSATGGILMTLAVIDIEW